MAKNVLITGASHGIGNALAHEFARNGYNLILVSENESELFEAADDLRSLYTVNVLSVVKDLSKDNAPLEICKELEENHLHVDILVNDTAISKNGFVDFPLSDDLYIIRLDNEEMMVPVKNRVDMYDELFSYFGDKAGASK